MVVDGVDVYERAPSPQLAALFAALRGGHERLVVQPEKAFGYDAEPTVPRHDPAAPATGWVGWGQRPLKADRDRAPHSTEAPDARTAAAVLVATFCDPSELSDVWVAPDADRVAVSRWRVGAPIDDQGVVSVTMQEV